MIIIVMGGIIIIISHILAGAPVTLASWLVTTSYYIPRLSVVVPLGCILSL